jgi:hypothetical protein
MAHLPGWGMQYIAVHAAAKTVHRQDGARSYPQIIPLARPDCNLAA